LKKRNSHNGVKNAGSDGFAYKKSVGGGLLPGKEDQGNRNVSGGWENHNTPPRETLGPTPPKSLEALKEGNNIDKVSRWKEKSSEPETQSSNGKILLQKRWPAPTGDVRDRSGENPDEIKKVKSGDSVRGQGPRQGGGNKREKKKNEL